MNLYMNKYGGSKYTIKYWYDGQKHDYDTEHAGDLIYALLRSKQLGYNTGGVIDKWLEHYQKHLDTVWFPTSAGFYEYANGAGNIN